MKFQFQSGENGGMRPTHLGQNIGSPLIEFADVHIPPAVKHLIDNGNFNIGMM